MKKAERLHKTNMKIKKRLEIVKMWGDDGIMTGKLQPHPLEKCPHKLHKWNLNCGCKMCKYYKHIGNNKAKFSHRDNKLKLKE